MAQVAGAPETLVGVPLACDRRRSRRKPAGAFLSGKTRCPGYCRFAPDRTQAVLLQWLIAGLVGAAVRHSGARLGTSRCGVSGTVSSQASSGCRTRAPTGFRFATDLLALWFAIPTKAARGPYPAHPLSLPSAGRRALRPIQLTQTFDFPCGTAHCAAGVTGINFAHFTQRPLAVPPGTAQPA